MYIQKDLANSLSQNSTKYLQNRIIKYCPELFYSLEKYCTSCSHSAVSKESNIIPKGIMKIQFSSNLGEGIYLFGIELPRLSLEFVLSFSKICTVFGIWE
jgi:hypothetical protein